MATTLKATGHKRRKQLLCQAYVWRLVLESGVEPPLHQQQPLIAKSSLAETSTSIMRSASTTTASVIISLPDDDVQMLKPIVATVEKLEFNNYLAFVPEVNLNASGDSKAEAIANLQDIIAGTYRLYAMLPPESLGPEPTRQWNFLKLHLR